MKKTIKNLFYSESESILFWVAGYRWDLSTTNVDDIIESLSEGVDIFKNLGGEGSIHTREIIDSRRYKRMRVYWCKTDSIPEDAFIIEKGNNWTMNKWLND